MQSRSGRSQKIRHNYMKIYGLTAALVVVVALIVAITVTSLGVVSGKNPPSKTDGPSPAPPMPAAKPPLSTPATPDSESTEASSKEEQVGKIQYITVTQNDLTAINPLRIVSPAAPFNPAGARDIVNMYDLADKSNSKNRLQFLGASSPLNKEAFEALQQLQFTVGSAHEGYCFMITQGYISVLNAEGKVNCNCSESELTDLSHSTHASGYVVDLRYLKDGAGYQVFDAAVQSTVTRTLLDNCGKFGWIQSWSGANLAANGKINTDQRNFRYVGVPHALYIMEKGLTFEGYLEALKTSTNFNKPLLITDNSTSTAYKIYYVAADTALSKGVPVPQGATYTVQGNGVDGFIVTLTESLGA